MRIKIEITEKWRAKNIFTDLLMEVDLKTVPNLLYRLIIRELSILLPSERPKKFTFVSEHACFCSHTETRVLTRQTIVRRVVICFVCFMCICMHRRMGSIACNPIRAVWFVCLHKTTMQIAGPHCFERCVATGWCIHRAVFHRVIQVLPTGLQIRQQYCSKIQETFQFQMIQWQAQNNRPDILRYSHRCLVLIRTDVGRLKYSEVCLMSNKE